MFNSVGSTKLQFFGLPLALLSLLSLCACPSAQTINSIINTAVIAGEALLPLIPGMDPSIKTYIVQGEEGLAFTLTELSTTDSNSVKALKISQEFATLVQPDLSLAPLPVILGVAGFAAGIAAVLAYVQSIDKPSMTMRVSQSGMSSTSKVQHWGDLMQPNAKDIKNFMSLRSKALNIAAKAKAIN